MNGLNFFKPYLKQPMLSEDINKFMLEALNMADIAFLNNEVPVGAIIVQDGIVIGKGFNQVISHTSVSSHAEINAINDASQNIKNYRLNNCDVYVTLEPCHMCAKAIVDARINHLFFGAMEPKTGAVQSIDNFLDHNHLNHKVSYSGGHMKEPSAELLKKFFQSKRG
jgi:tRNA(adenine34) deaminase|tara:strand:+ start:4623 stop:5123 length:501 start_codon:yes stop_codon:yes gene_type:complete